MSCFLFITLTGTITGISNLNGDDNLTFVIRPHERKDIINFGLVYCRVSADESSFRNLRGKICPKFACECNRLRVSLLVRGMTKMCRISMC